MYCIHIAADPCNLMKKNISSQKCNSPTNISRGPGLRPIIHTARELIKLCGGRKIRSKYYKIFFNILRTCINFYASQNLIRVQ